MPPLPNDLEFLRENHIYEEYEPNDDSFNNGNGGLNVAEI